MLINQKVSHINMKHHCNNTFEIVSGIPFINEENILLNLLEIFLKSYQKPLLFTQNRKHCSGIICK